MSKQESCGPAFDAAGERYEGVESDKSVKSATRELTIEARAKARQGRAVVKPQPVTSGESTREQRFQDHLRRNGVPNKIGEVTGSGEATRKPDYLR